MKKLLFLALLPLPFFAVVTPHEMTASSLTQVLPHTAALNIKEIFLASPIIYCVLFLLSLGSVTLWLYTFLTFRKKELFSKFSLTPLQEFLIHENYSEAIGFCKKRETILTKMILSGITSRHLGLQSMTEMMKSEGKRATTYLWQRISLLNDVVMIAPMIGLMGTVLGMFYAFYDLSRSGESLFALFDGLGIAVGTTVGGLVVSIFTTVLSTSLKFRIVLLLGQIENEALSLGNLIQHRKFHV